MKDINETKAEVVKVAKEMLRQKLATFSWGNVSARVPESNLAVITPSGLNYDKLKTQDMVVIDLKGRVIEGHYKPSIETPMHTAIYLARSDVKAIVHTHSPFATCFAVVNKELRPILAEQAAVLGATIPVARYATTGTSELAEIVVEVLGEKLPAVLLQNHGVVAVGSNLDEALKIASTIEEAAQVYLLSSHLGVPIEIPEEEVAKLHGLFLTKYGQKDA